MGGATDIQWLGVNLAKFNAAPQSACILRLLVMSNDIDSIVLLNKLLNQYSLEHNFILHLKWIDGVKLYLMRQNMAVMLDTLKELITNMGDKVSKIPSNSVSGKGTQKLLWEFIASEPDLLKQLQALNLIVSSPEFDVAYKGLCLVRDKLAAHADMPLLKQSLGILLTDKEYQQGLVVRTTGAMRVLFVDDVLSQAWQSVGMLAPNDEKDLVRAEMDKYVSYVSKLRQDLIGFASSLFHAYVDYYELGLSDEDKDSIQQLISDQGSSSPTLT